jgi:hypothetical protein
MDSAQYDHFIHQNLLRSYDFFPYRLKTLQFNLIIKTI